MSRTRRVTTPRAPRCTTAPGKEPSPRPISAMSPSAVTISRAATAAARFWLAGPEPWVPVAQAPATEMCGSEARLRSAKPWRSRRLASGA